MTLPIDYDAIAPRYDAHRTGAGPHMACLAGLAAECRAREVLELGAGTGNTTAALIAAHPCAVTALDASRGMILASRAKAIPARWVRGQATHLPFRARSFDFVFGAYMLHYIADLGALFRACRAVLRPRGIAAFVTVPESFIEAHPMNRWFPSFARIDRARFQPLAQVEGALRSAGFDAVQTTRTVSPPRRIDAAYAEKVANKFISTYDLLPPEEFAAGLARLRAELAAGQVDAVIAREASVVSGRVPAEPLP